MRVVFPPSDLVDSQAVHSARVAAQRARAVAAVDVPVFDAVVRRTAARRATIDIRKMRVRPLAHLMSTAATSRLNSASAVTGPLWPSYVALHLPATGSEPGSSNQGPLSSFHRLMVPSSEAENTWSFWYTIDRTAALENVRMVTRGEDYLCPRLSSFFHAPQQVLRLRRFRSFLERAGGGLYRGSATSRRLN
jgi:hypothetical protein